MRISTCMPLILHLVFGATEKRFVMLHSVNSGNFPSRTVLTPWRIILHVIFEENNLWKALALWISPLRFCKKGFTEDMILQTTKPIALKRTLARMLSLPIVSCLDCSDLDKENEKMELFLKALWDCDEAENVKACEEAVDPSDQNVHSQRCEKVIPGPGGSLWLLSSTVFWVTELLRLSLMKRLKFGWERHVEQGSLWKWFRPREFPPGRPVVANTRREWLPVGTVWRNVRLQICTQLVLMLHKFTVCSRSQPCRIGLWRVRHSHCFSFGINKPVWTDCVAASENPGRLWCDPKWIVTGALYGLTTAPRDWGGFRDATLSQRTWCGTVDGSKVQFSFNQLKDPNVWQILKTSREWCRWPSVSWQRRSYWSGLCKDSVSMGDIWVWKGQFVDLAEVLRGGASQHLRRAQDSSGVLCSWTASSTCQWGASTSSISFQRILLQTLKLTLVPGFGRWTPVDQWQDWAWYCRGSSQDQPVADQKSSLADSMWHWSSEVFEACPRPWSHLPWSSSSRSRRRSTQEN